MAEATLHTLLQSNGQYDDLIIVRLLYRQRESIGGLAPTLHRMSDGSAGRLVVVARMHIERM
eukprot:gene3802-8378_t